MLIITRIKMSHSAQIRFDLIHSNAYYLKHQIIGFQLLSWSLKLVHWIEICIQFEMIYVAFEKFQNKKWNHMLALFYSILLLLLILLLAMWNNKWK